jgi:hypothetical protein
MFIDFDNTIFELHSKKYKVLENLILDYVQNSTQSKIQKYTRNYQKFN